MYCSRIYFWWIYNDKKSIQVFQCIAVLQWWGEGPENLSRICPTVMCLFRTFSPQLENNDTSQFCSGSFAHTLRYVVNVGKLSEFHWNVSMSFNCGEKVLNGIEIEWTQDFRVQRMQCNQFWLLSLKKKFFEEENDLVSYSINHKAV